MGRDTDVPKSRMTAGAASYGYARKHVLRAQTGRADTRARARAGNAIAFLTPSFCLENERSSCIVGNAIRLCVVCRSAN